MSQEKKTGLWARKTKNGVDVLSGSIGEERIMIFKNEFKTEEKHPDYILKLFPKTTPQQVGGAPSVSIHSVKSKEEELPF